MSRGSSDAFYQRLAFFAAEQQRVRCQSPRDSAQAAAHVRWGAEGTWTPPPYTPAAEEAIMKVSVGKRPPP